MTATVVQTFERDLSRFAFAINQLGEGRSNATGSLILTPNATSTAVVAINCGADSVVLLSPLTASARTALNGSYISATRAGGFTVTHPSSAAIDQAMKFVCLG